jgi:CubicO group peptidase (beta-lactamase class C family)
MCRIASCILDLIYTPISHGLCFGPEDSPADVIHKMCYLRPIYEIRQKWDYNTLVRSSLSPSHTPRFSQINQMYILATEIVTRLSGHSYVDFVTARIFEPLGMNHTTFHPDVAATSGRLAHIFTREGRRIPFWVTEDTMAINAGAGGVISTSADLAG